MKIKIFIAILLTMMIVATGMNTRAIEDVVNHMNYKLDIEDARNACVTVYSDRGFTGSGTHIGGGIILTAGHVVDIGCTSVMDGDGNEYQIIDSFRDPQQDIGFLIIDKDCPLPILELGNMPEILDEIYIISNPYFDNFYQNVNKGIVSNLYVKFYIWDNLIVVDAEMARGSSGGCLLDKHLNIIGIVVGGPNPAGGGVNCCEPVIDIIECLEEYKNDRSGMQQD